MSISYQQYARAGILKRAMDEAGEMIGQWVESEVRGGDARVGDVVAHWTWVSLCERVARKLCIARGYDEVLLDLACDGDPPRGMTLGDLDALLDAYRNKPIPEEVWRRLGIDEVGCPLTEVTHGG